MTRYGYTIEWTTLEGRQAVTVTDCSTAMEAFEETYRLALKSGWRPPRWWQFWRWGDMTPEPPIYLEKELMKP